MTTRLLSDDEDVCLLQAIDRVRQGDSDAFEVIYHQCYDRLQRFCRRRLCWADRCIHYEEDLASEILICLWKSLRDPQTELGTPNELWHALHRLVFERCIDRAKYNNQLKRRNELELPLLFDELYGHRVWAINAAEVDAADLVQVLRGEIPDDKARAFVMSKLIGLSNREIAQQWQVTIRTVQRTMECVRKLFEEKIENRVVI